MTERVNPGVVLEIGVGAFPFPPNPTMLESHDKRKLSREFKYGSRYIGIDFPADPDRYWDSMMAFFTGQEGTRALTDEERALFHANLARAQVYSARQRPGESINFLMADAHNLPFRDEIADEVFLSNVFGSQLGDQSLDKILGNVRRVLKRGGKIVIRETATPQWSLEDMLPDTLNKHGFSLEELVHHGSERYSELLNTYGATLKM